MMKMFRWAIIVLLLIGAMAAFGTVAVSQFAPWTWRSQRCVPAVIVGSVQYDEEGRLSAYSTYSPDVWDVALQDGLNICYCRMATDAEKDGTEHWISLAGLQVGTVVSERVRYFGIQLPPCVLYAAFALLGAYPAAILIRSVWSRWRNRKRNQCVHCGYNLTGNVSGVCPECGRSTSC